MYSFMFVLYGPLWPCSLQGRSRAWILDIPPRHFLADYIESIHSRNGFSRDRMTLEAAAAFDAECRVILVPLAEAGLLRFSVTANMVWGQPALFHPHRWKARYPQQRERIEPAVMYLRAPRHHLVVVLQPQSEAHVSNSMPTVTELVHRYKREEMSYDDLKAAILGRQFDRLPYPLWADSSDYSQWGFHIPGTWHEFIEFYDNGTLSHDEWWGLAGEHPDWSGAIQEEPASCDPQQGFIEWHRQPVRTANGLEIAVTTDRKGLTESASEDGEVQR